MPNSSQTKKVQPIKRSCDQNIYLILQTVLLTAVTDLFRFNLQRHSWVETALLIAGSAFLLSTARVGDILSLLLAAQNLHQNLHNSTV